MSRVFINALCAGNRSGTGRYASQLCEALSRRETDDRFVVLLEEGHRLVEGLAGRPTVEVITVPARPPALRALWEAARLPGLVRRTGADLFHGPAFTAPRRLSCPSVVTIHDCVFLRFPETIRRSRRFFYGRSIQGAANRAACVMVDSESTGRDVESLMGIPRERIKVVPLGVGPEFFVSKEEPDGSARIRKQVGVDGDFILSAGTLEPRKNLETLIRSYGELKRRRPGTPPLVLAGRKGWMSDSLTALVDELDLSDDVRWPGFVDDRDLPSLMALATVFVCVSLYEGFGLPPLEAMAAGTPVIVSNTSSLPEVVGDAGRLVDPRDPAMIAGAIEELLVDSELRDSLAAAGRDRAEAFTWDRTAAAVHDVYGHFYF